ncbi:MULTISPECIES: GspI family T2SS minor pseudopilin variant LspI [Legionella]|uniref:Type II secretion system protein I n=1 Tax=Legionella maceachernii TaxID=466 RepID=A0A0W0WF56_9GAMM|nr:GspI family T2SS minor pseudopilin variant LspI [Legionella maceachernii]KTD30646.1 type II secretory pathway protein LspI [Legionella maceachernii]SJZ81329.1 general secretion pathway protein I [Legionella maceachernii]SUP02791.1 Tfp pilus assembly protein PilV [Legionella maceachernii]
MTNSIRKRKQQGFTLIEVLLALSVIAIALTALFKATAQNVSHTQRIKEKAISHWVAMQGVSMIQLGLLQLGNQEITQVTSMLGQRWYWRARTDSTPIKSVHQITITVSRNQAGPFQDPLVAFWYRP